jgi:hypothetical protein
LKTTLENMVQEMFLTLDGQPGDIGELTPERE